MQCGSGQGDLAITVILVDPDGAKHSWVSGETWSLCGLVRTVLVYSSSRYGFIGSIYFMLPIKAAFTSSAVQLSSCKSGQMFSSPSNSESMWTL